MIDAAVQASAPTTTAARGWTADRRWRRVGILAGWAGVVSPFLIEALAILRASQEWLIGRTPDDAFYYLEVARRIDRGQGFTFDGIHATNGFHPLWQWILAGVGVGMGGQTAFIKADLLVCLALVFVALLLIIRLVWRWLGPGPALMGAVLAVHSRDAMTNLADGMEGALSVLLLALLVTALVCWFERPTARRAAIVGVISAALVLARLDMLAVIWIVPVVMGGRARSWRPVLGFAAGAAAGLPWALWYWTRYHHLLTTSAMVKQSQVSALARTEGGWLSHGYLSFVWNKTDAAIRSVLGLAWDSAWRDTPVLGVVLGLVGVGLAGIGLVSYLRTARSGAQRQDIAMAAAGETRAPTASSAIQWGLGTVVALLAVKAAFDLVSAPMWADTWYLTPQRVAVPFALGTLGWLGAREVVGRWPRGGLVAAACLCLVALPLNGAQLADSPSAQLAAGSWQGQLDLATSWVLAHGPTGRYGASDAGLVGYRLNGTHDVVDVDGLVNDYAGVALVNSGASLPTLLRANQVDVYLNRVTPEVLASLTCARVLWTSPQPIVWPGTRPGTITKAPIYVLDVRSCR